MVKIIVKFSSPIGDIKQRSIKEYHWQDKTCGEKHVLSSKEVPNLTKEYARSLSEFLWYDSFYGEMKFFKASSLSYKYVTEKYIEFEDGSKKPEAKTTKEEKLIYGINEVKRLVAQPEYFKIKPQKGKSKELLKKWFRDYQNYNDIFCELVSEDNEGITIEIDEKDIEDILYDADRNGVRFEIL